jgi:hypothetical protein
MARVWLLALVPSLALAPFACSSEDAPTADAEADASIVRDGTVPSDPGPEQRPDVADAQPAEVDAGVAPDAPSDAPSDAAAEVVVVDLAEGGVPGCKATCNVIPKTTPVCSPINPADCTLSCTEGTDCTWSCPLPDCALDNPVAPLPQCTLECDRAQYACAFERPECEIRCSDEICRTQPPQFGCITKCKPPVGRCSRVGTGGTVDAGPVLTCRGGTNCSFGCALAQCSCRSNFAAGGTCERYPSDGAPPSDCGDAAIIPLRIPCASLRAAGPSIATRGPSVATSRAIKSARR